MSNAKAKFALAARFVPAEENINTRRFVLYENDLYFEGDRSWFIIRNFVESPSNIILTYSDIDLITTLDGKVTVQEVQLEHMVKRVFTNGTKSLTIACLEAKEKPGIEPPVEDNEFSLMSDVLLRGRKIFGLTDEYSNIGIFPHKTEDGDDVGYVAFVSTAGLAALSGDAGLDMNLTKVRNVIEAAIASKARIYVRGKIAYFLTDMEDYSIYSATKFSRCSVPNAAKKSVIDVMSGNMEKEKEHLIEIKVKGKDMLSTLPTANKLKSIVYATYSVQVDEDGNYNKLIITMSDELRREYRAEIPCEASDKYTFYTRVIGRNVIDYLGSAIGEIDEMTLVMTVHATKTFLIMRAKYVDEDGIEPAVSDAFVMTLVRQGVFGG